MESNKKGFTEFIVLLHSILCPRGSTTSRSSLVRDMLSPNCNGCFVSSCSAPDCPIVLEIRVPIPQSPSVSVVGCSSEDVIMPQGLSTKHPTHVQSDLNQE
ncbi:hypothetical protein TNCV_2816621 [Trichonephila clavipes]|nr:hypothetical protein TNCV_2816621 [Trichonephila clavipes]